MAECLLFDNSKVKIRAQITYKPKETRLPFLHRAYGKNYQNSYLIPSVTGCIQDKVKDFAYYEMDFDALEYGIADEIRKNLSLEDFIDILDIRLVDIGSPGE